MIKSLAKNPIIQTILAVLGIALSIFFYINSTKEMLPTYSISRIESLASINKDIPNLKILWKGKKIEELKRLKILIFNNGKQYIDKKNISSTQPIRIMLPKGIELLQYRVAKTSRKNLDFQLEKKDNEIILKINGDDALEYKDGVLITLLLTGNSKENISIKGRIKGSQTDFKNIEWSKVSTSNLFNMFAMIGLSIIFILFIFMFSIKINMKRNDEKTLIFNVDNIVNLVMLFYFIFIFYNSVSSSYYSVPWLT